MLGKMDVCLNDLRMIANVCASCCERMKVLCGNVMPDW
jgi:hypothetical protein